jgi:hypothetical protein
LKESTDLNTWGLYIWKVSCPIGPKLLEPVFEFQNISKVQTLVGSNLKSDRSKVWERKAGWILTESGPI